MNSSDIINTSDLPSAAAKNYATGPKAVNLLIRIFALSVVAVMLIFLINNYGLLITNATLRSDLDDS